MSWSVLPAYNVPPQTSVAPSTPTTSAESPHVCALSHVQRAGTDAVAAARTRRPTHGVHPEWAYQCPKLGASNAATAPIVPTVHLVVEFVLCAAAATTAHDIAVPLSESMNATPGSRSRGSGDFTSAMASA